jgi:hypothetical protein
VQPKDKYQDDSKNSSAIEHGFSQHPSLHLNAHISENNLSSKNSTCATTCLGGLAIALFLGLRKEIVNYFKVHNFSHNPHLFNISLSLAAIIVLATIRTIASTVIKVDYIRYQSKKEKEEKQTSSRFAQCVVYLNMFIAASAIFIPTYNTFNSYGAAICSIMVIYAVSSSIYSSMKFAKPLICDISDYFINAICGKKRKQAREKLYSVFFGNRRRTVKFIITTIGTLTSSLFLYYSLHHTFYLAMFLPTKYILRCEVPSCLWHVSAVIAFFIILWVFIPGYSLTFREEAKALLNTKELSDQSSHEEISTTYPVETKRKKPTAEFNDLCKKVGNHKNQLMNCASYVLFYFFILIGIICWFVCALVLSVGTYIGAQHVFSGFKFCTVASDVIFVIDFLYQVNYYGTELPRKLLNKLMSIPLINGLFIKPQRLLNNEEGISNKGSPTPCNDSHYEIMTK